MTTIQATSFQFQNTGSTNFTVTKPGGTTDAIAPGEEITYNPRGVYSADVTGVQAFTIDFTGGDLKIAQGTGAAPAGTSAKINTFMN